MVFKTFKTLRMDEHRGLETVFLEFKRASLSSGQAVISASLERRGHEERKEKPCSLSWDLGGPCGQAATRGKGSFRKRKTAHNVKEAQSAGKASQNVR